MPAFSSFIKQLIDEFNKFPGIGTKTAERFVFYLLSQSKEDLERLSLLFANLKDKVTICSRCFNFAEKNPCSICSNPKRDQGIICIVAKPQDLMVIENTGEYNGLYHILGGNLNSLKGVTPEKLKFKELAQRMQTDKKIKEIIIATNHDLEGETTSMYLIKLLRPCRVKISRLARGLPMGSDLEYADEITLSSALKGRQEI